MSVQSDIQRIRDLLDDGDRSRAYELLSALLQHCDSNLLTCADSLINGQRQSDYGSPQGNFEDIAALWTRILDVPVTPRRVLLCMIALKLARLSHQPDHRDSIVDLAGYAGLFDRVTDALHTRRHENSHSSADTAADAGSAGDLAGERRRGSPHDRPEVRLPAQVRQVVERINVLCDEHTYAGAPALSLASFCIQLRKVLSDLLLHTE